MRSCIRLMVLVLGSAVASSGCTAVSLERYTRNQIRSVVDFRYREVLHCLAVVAANPGALPPYGLLTAGSTRIADTGTVAPMTQWAEAVHGFSMQMLGLTAARAPTENWTIIPAAEHLQLEALRCACQWVLKGPEKACGSCPGLLASPEQDPSPGPHFGVADRLARLPAGWVHVGGLTDIPASACYKAHCGHTWVWVMPEDMEGLSEFTLVLEDIATLDLNQYAPPQLLITLTWTVPCNKANQKADAKLGFKDDAQSVYTETRVIKPEYVPTVTAILLAPAPVDLRGVPWEEYTTPQSGPRANVNPTGNISNAALRSAVVAAGAPSPGTSPFIANPFGPGQSPFSANRFGPRR